MTTAYILISSGNNILTLVSNTPYSSTSYKGVRAPQTEDSAVRNLSTNQLKDENCETDLNQFFKNQHIIDHSIIDKADFLKRKARIVELELGSKHKDIQF